MWTIEPVIDPDQPDQILCYLIIDENDIPRGHYDRRDEAERAIAERNETIKPPSAANAYYPT